MLGAAAAYSSRWSEVTCEHRPPRGMGRATQLHTESPLAFFYCVSLFPCWPSGRTLPCLLPASSGGRQSLGLWAAAIAVSASGVTRPSFRVSVCLGPQSLSLEGQESLGLCLLSSRMAPS